MHSLALRLVTSKYLPIYWMLVVGGVLALLAVFALGGLNYAGLAAYPDRHLAPGSHLSGVYVGGLDYARASAKLEEEGFDRRPLELYVDNETVATTYEGVGVRFDLEGTFEEVLSHQHTLRESPSSGWKFWGWREDLLNATVDEESLEQFLNEHLPEYRSNPADATLVLSAEGEVEIVPSEAVWGIETDVLGERLLAAARGTGDSVTVPVHKQEPNIEESQLQGMAAHMRDLAGVHMELTHEDEIYEIGKNELISWLYVSENEDGWPEPGVDREATEAYLHEIAENIDEDPVPGEREVRDGEVVEESQGEAGSRLNVDKSFDRIVQAWLEQTSNEITVSLAVDTLEPSVIQNVTYSGDSSRAEAIMARFAAERAGLYGIQLISLSGNIAAGHNADRHFVTASTYKAFLAYAVYHEIENGRLRSSDSTGAGTVGFCIKEMIVNSTNPCAIALGEKIGWQRADNLLATAGFDQTKLNNYSGRSAHKVTTPRDAAYFMGELEGGRLLNATHRQQLLGYMRTQVFRSGIPAGLPGYGVANKVGFLPPYTNDVGIIYGRDDTYVLAAYSSGGSFHDFAELSRRLADILQ